MEYENRAGCYARIEEIRNRPLIVYATSVRSNSSANMASDVIPEFIKQIELIPKDITDVDVLIVSNGGDPITSWRIMGILRERFERIGVLVPFVAYSAATLLALGADEIVMHPYSNIGPIDPQVTVSKPNGRVSFSSEDIRYFIEFVKKDFGISGQAELSAALGLLCKNDIIDPINLGTTKRSQQLSIALGEKMLSMHMKDAEKAHTIAEKLNSSFYHHGYTVGRKEAESMGLNVQTPPPALQELMWSVWSSLCCDMECNKPFDLMAEIMNNPSFEYLKTAQTVSVPINIPAPITQQIVAQITAQNCAAQVRNTVVLRRLLAVIESVRCRSGVFLESNVLAWRNIDGNISVNVTDSTKGWEDLA